MAIMINIFHLVTLALNIIKFLYLLKIYSLKLMVNTVMGI